VNPWLQQKEAASGSETASSIKDSPKKKPRISEAFQFSV